MTAVPERAPHSAGSNQLTHESLRQFSLKQLTDGPENGTIEGGSAYRLVSISAS
jgi:hypothetical protein